MPRLHTRHLTLLLATTALFCACGGDSKANTDTSTADTMAQDSSAGDTAVTETHDPDTSATDTPAADTAPADASSSCTHTGFAAVTEDAGAFLGAFMYFAQSTLEAPVDVLTFELVPANAGATSAGSYPLTNDDYASCGNCVLVYTACDDSLANCAKTFLAHSGTLTITAFGTPGQRFTGTLNDVVLAEVEIASDFSSTLVPGGETWCLPTYTFDAEVQ